MISWTTLESYPLRVGVSLPVLNPALEEGEEMFHEAQLWEETEEQWIVTENHAAFVYDWLSQRFASRSSGRALPAGMPTSVDEVAVQTKKVGEFGYILFTPEASLAEAMKKMEVQVLIEYDDGYMRVGMGNAYTIRMLWEEYRSLTHETWEFGPSLPIRRTLDGTIVHEITWEWSELKALINEDAEVQHPPKIVEDRGRGTMIRNLANQGKLLQYWARTQSSIQVGIFLPAELDDRPWNIEYWMDLAIQPIPDAQPEGYVAALGNLCFEKISEFSGATAQWFDGVNEYRVETGYAFNGVRFWLCPKSAYGTRIKRPMAEDPSPRSKWYLANGVMAFTSPLFEEVRDAPQRLFGQEAQFQEQYVDEEVQGGKIVLIAFKQMRAQKPPNCLDRMQSTFSKQVAYNQRILEAENQIAGINCDVPHFLEEMTADEPVFVCTNGCEEMKLDEQATACQLWVQGDRQMTASNVAPPGNGQHARFGTPVRGSRSGDVEPPISAGRRPEGSESNHFPEGTYAA
jgi:hypothetical protein